MNVQFDPADFRGLIQSVVAETLAAVETLPADRLGYSEAEAAALCGMQKHQLRDARLRGEVHGVRVGKQIFYERGELVALLSRRATR